MTKTHSRFAPFDSAEVATHFEAHPAKVRSRLMKLRQLIFDTAAKIEGVGKLEETLRWGEPSYLTTESGSGTMIRIDSKGPDGRCYVFVHCQTNLISRFRKLYPDAFEFVGNRGIAFDAEDIIPTAELGHCIAMALTYHRDKRLSSKATESRRALGFGQVRRFQPRVRDPRIRM